MLRYEKISIEDLDGLIHLYETYLNSGEEIRSWLESGLTDSRYAGAKCVDGGKIIGAFTGRPGIEFTCGHEDIVEQIQGRWPDLEIYTADMLAVESSYRGFGIARELSYRFRDCLVSNGCELLVIEEWHRSLEDDVPVSGVLKYIGEHEILGSYKDFYKDLDKYGMICPECKGNCECGAIICVIKTL